MEVVVHINNVRPAKVLCLIVLIVIIKMFVKNVKIPIYLIFLMDNVKLVLAKCRDVIYASLILKNVKLVLPVNTITKIELNVKHVLNGC